MEFMHEKFAIIHKVGNSLTFLQQEMILNILSKLFSIFQIKIEFFQVHLNLPKKNSHMF